MDQLGGGGGGGTKKKKKKDAKEGGKSLATQSVSRKKLFFKLRRYIVVYW